MERLQDRLRHLTAAQYLKAYAAGHLLTASSVAIIYWLPAPSVPDNLVVGIAFAALAMAPVLICFWFTHTIQKHIELAIAEQRWPGPTVESIRTGFKSTAWKVFTGTILALLILLCVASFFEPYKHFRGVYWMFFMISNGFNRLPLAFREPKPTPPPALTASQPVKSTQWGKLPPIHHKFWG